jgi:DNA-binding IclR family transcriptional regulator
MTDELSDRHAAVLAWLGHHPSGSVERMADELGIPVVDAEALVAELVATGMLERTSLH